MTRYLFLILILFVSPLYAATYEPKGDVIGAVTYYTAKQVDTLYEVARRFDIGIVEILAANPGVDVWQPQAGTRLALTTAHLLPRQREGIVINLAELRLFYFRGDGKVMTFPIGIGRSGWQTPLGKTTIVTKRTNPIWTPPASIRKEKPGLPEFIPAGPDNPLGEYAMNLGLPGYVIHGTNRPYGVGRRSSHGCIRLYPEDIKQLFPLVEIGTPVTIIDEPYKLGWQEGNLLLEVTPSQEQSDAISEHTRARPIGMPGIYHAIKAAAPDRSIDWRKVDRTIAGHPGIPVAITNDAPPLEARKNF